MAPSTDLAEGVATRTALWVLAVQCLLALSWTLYVLFLPGLLAAAGIARNWFVYVLIVVFHVSRREARGDGADAKAFDAR